MNKANQAISSYICCQVRGSRDVVGSSNIRMHDLRFELTSFKALHTLEVGLRGSGSP